MKVLFLTRKYPPSVGGMESFAYGLSRAYLKLDPAAQIWKWGGSRWHLVWWLPLMAVRLSLTRTADTIHLLDGVMVLLAPFARLYNRRVVVTIHGLEVTFQNPVYQWLFVRGLRRVQAIVSVSTATAKLVEDFARQHQIILGPQGIEHTVITHGVQTPHMRRDQAQTWLANRFSITLDTRLILLVGRLVERKGQAWFLREVAPHLADSNTWIAVVGDGAERMAVQSAAVGVNNLRIVVCGRVSEEELAAWYARANVMVMPNRSIEGDVEGFGMVALEAQSYGCPVVASRLQGITDAVQAGVTGELVEPMDVQGFIQHITQVSQWDEHRRQQLAQQTIAGHSWQQIARSYQQVYFTKTTNRLA